jgi:outer membrane protein TolC
MASDYRALEEHASASRADDERAFSAPQLERAALVRAVLDRNPSLESARQAWRAALARYRQAGAYEEPIISLEVAPLSVGSSRARLGYEVGISQRIPLGGKLDAQAAQAAAEAEVAASDFKQARLELALAASQLYDDYFVAMRSLAVQAEHLELIEALKQSAVAAYESGHASVQDSLRADAELARLEYQSTVFTTERDVAIAQINALLHRDPDAPLPAPTAALPNVDVDDVTRAASIAETTATRPDVAAAEARARVARAKVDAARADYAPDLMLSTAYNSMWDMAQHRWTAGVAISIPLQRERRSAAVEEASAMRASSESEARSMTDAARAEISVLARRIEQARQAVILYDQRLLPVARQQIEAARSGFVASQNGFLTVIEAEHGLRSAELEAQVVRAQLSKYRAELERARGRLAGLEGSEAAP